MDDPMMVLSRKGTLAVSEKDFFYYEHFTAGNDTAVVIVKGLFSQKDDILIEHLKTILLDTYDVLIFDRQASNVIPGTASQHPHDRCDINALVAFVRRSYDKIGLVKLSNDALVVSELTVLDSLVTIGKNPQEIVRNIGSDQPRKKKNTNTAGSVSPDPQCPVLHIKGEKTGKPKVRNTRVSKKRGARKEYPAGKLCQSATSHNKDTTIQLIKEWFQKTIHLPDPPVPDKTSMGKD